MEQIILSTPPTPPHIHHWNWQHIRLIIIWAILLNGLIVSAWIYIIRTVFPRKTTTYHDFKEDRVLDRMSNVQIYELSKLVEDKVLNIKVRLEQLEGKHETDWWNRRDGAIKDFERRVLERTSKDADEVGQMV